mmetsp:Transcript_91630/g.245476  ORF Transcript_91630/g.245476 Transcript_91630/m.245476 type:complete len:571 (+) Transcript_91630:28-1740(+)
MPLSIQAAGVSDPPQPDVVEEVNDMDQQGLDAIGPHGNEPEQLGQAAAPSTKPSRAVRLLMAVLLAAAGVLLMTTAFQIYISWMLAQDSAEVLSTYNFVRESSLWVAALLGFAMVGTTNEVSSALAVGQSQQVAPAACRAVLLSAAVGAVPALCGLTMSEQILEIAGFGDASQDGKALFRMLWMVGVLWLPVNALSGVMTALMNFPTLLSILAVAGLVSSSLSIGIYHSSGSLRAFGYGAISWAAIVAVGFILVLAGTGARRTRFGFVGLKWISWPRCGWSKEVAWGPMASSASRSILSQTRALMSVAFIANISDVHSALYKLLGSQMSLVHGVATVIGLACHAVGARLYCGGREKEFWVLCAQGLWWGCWIVIVITVLQTSRGRSALVAEVEASEVQDYLSAHSSASHALFVLLHVPIFVGQTCEHILMAAQHFRFVAGEVSLAFVAYVIVAIIGYSRSSFVMIVLAELTFHSFRASICLLKLGQLRHAGGAWLPPPWANLADELERKWMGRRLPAWVMMFDIRTHTLCLNFALGAVVLPPGPRAVASVVPAPMVDAVQPVVLGSGSSP